MRAPCSCHISPPLSSCHLLSSTMLLSFVVVITAACVLQVACVLHLEWFVMCSCFCSSSDTLPTHHSILHTIFSTLDMTCRVSPGRRMEGSKEWARRHMTEHVGPGLLLLTSPVPEPVFTPRSLACLNITFLHLVFLERNLVCYLVLRCLLRIAWRPAWSP